MVHKSEKFIFLKLYINNQLKTFLNINIINYPNRTVISVVQLTENPDKLGGPTVSILSLNRVIM